MKTVFGFSTADSEEIVINLYK